MIRIKAVDAQNISDVCELSTSQDVAVAKTEGRCRCNAISIAETRFDAEMHPNAIYNNNALIGFFMYKRAETQADTATICRFMLDDRFKDKGLEEKALEHVLRGLKIQGVKRVILSATEANEEAEKLYRSYGFHAAGEAGCYELELQS